MSDSVNAVLKRDKMSYFVRPVNMICKVGGIIAGYGILIMMLIVVLNVILRMSGKALLGTYEIVELIMPLIVALALGYCTSKGGHVTIGVIFEHLKPPASTVLAIIAIILSLSIWALIAWFGAGFAREGWLIGESTLALKLPVYPLRYVFVLGAVIVCLALLVDLFKALRKEAHN